MRVREGRQERKGRTDVDSMDASLVEPMHSFTLPAFVLVFPSCPSHYPRVCEIGVVVAVVVVCFIRSVSLIGGYYTYSNLFFVWFLLLFCLFFSPRRLPHRVCARRACWIPSTTLAHDDTAHRLTPTMRLCRFLPLLLPSLVRWFVRIIILAFRRPILSFSLSFPPSVAPFTPHLTRTWSCLVRYIYQLAFRIYVLCTTTRSLRPLKPVCRLCACPIISVRINTRSWIE